MKNGVPQLSLGPTELADALIGAGSFSADSRDRFPGRYRVAVLENLSRVSSRLGVHGFTGLVGEPWTPASRSALAAPPGVHAQMIEILRSTGDPEDY